MIQSPLAERMRPRKLEDFMGQHQIVGDQSALYRSIKNNNIPSMIFWGPPGCGKTTLANIIKEETNYHFITLSAVHSGVKDIKHALEEARQTVEAFKNATILFIDEIHRFNKSQQDALLMGVENGTITLIGATTENPSFELNNALLSRCQLLLLGPLSKDNQKILMDRALKDERGMAREDVELEEELQDVLIAQADGDARYLLNQLEWIVNAAESSPITLEFFNSIAIQNPLRYDKDKDAHFDMASVLQKSIRGSDVHAALYWLHRMIGGGENPRYLFRRLMRIAMEDVGNADPQAIQLATSCHQAYELMGREKGILLWNNWFVIWQQRLNPIALSWRGLRRGNWLKRMEIYLCRRLSVTL